MGEATLIVTLHGPNVDADMDGDEWIKDMTFAFLPRVGESVEVMRHVSLSRTLEVEWVTYDFNGRPRIYLGAWCDAKTAAEQQEEETLLRSLGWRPAD